jgi:ABC-type sugar transport system ATPase subunit
MVNGRPLLRLQRIHKQFGGAPVLTDVCMDVHAGEIHALVGENGAGKSTLMNIVTAVISPDEGMIEWLGRPVHIRNPRAARDLGIGFVHQELALVPQLSVAENIFLGRHPARGFGLRVVKWRDLREHARLVLTKLGCGDLDPEQLIQELSIGEQQMVEIARGIAFESRLIIMDEPTAPLSDAEAARLFGIIRNLRADGVSIVYITHRLKEVYALADRVTVLRDGRHVATAPVADLPADVLVRQMVGRELSDDAGVQPGTARDRVALRLEGLTRESDYRDISFEIRSGEIVALAGVVGSGRTEILESVFALTPADTGRLWVQGTERSMHSPADAIRAGLALVPNDRRAKGLILGASVLTNTVLASHRRFRINSRKEEDAAGRITRELHVRGGGLRTAVGQLSGGNQQKVVLAKWLLTNVKVLLMDEPTRGVDVGVKAEIYAIIRGLAASGVAVLLASSEMEEVLRLAHRVIVFHRGRVAGELSRNEATDERIMRLATGMESA